MIAKRTVEELDKEWLELTQAVFGIIAGKEMQMVAAVLGTVLGRACHMLDFPVDKAVDIVLREYRTQKANWRERMKEIANGPIIKEEVTK